MAHLPIGHASIYGGIDRDTVDTVRQYVEERFREAGWYDSDRSCTPLDIKGTAFLDAYHIVVRVPARRQDIPDEMLQLAMEIEEELTNRGYPTLVIVRPTLLPVAGR